MDKRIGLTLRILVSMAVVSVLLFFGTEAKSAGPYYTNSAHGNSSTGVKRNWTDPTISYSQGNCVHCHEQHASINDAEPDPVLNGNPSNYTLFTDNFIDQTNDFCFACHDGTSTVQAVTNRSYSYRVGGYTTDTLSNIKDAFNNLGWSSHNLSDIKSFLTFQSWGYTSNSNPCSACHNSHAATAARPVSRPSQFNKDNNTWALWGDDSPAERMSTYTSNYQEPYLYLQTTQYEPAAGNLTDYVTFCTDCHNSSNNISSSTLGTLKKIDWSAAGLNADKHGQVNADGATSLDNPYISTPYTPYVLACTDCHEPHGSPNQMLLRFEVNGNQLNATSTYITGIYPIVNGCTLGLGVDTDKSVAYLCDRCHKDDNEFSGSCQVNRYYTIHHDNASAGDAPYPSPLAGTCNNCHPGTDSGTGCNNTVSAINCNCCHYHGASVDPGGGARKTF